MEPKMTNEFYEWLDQCPVEWIRVEHNSESITYKFYVPDDDEQE